MICSQACSWDPLKPLFSSYKKEYYPDPRTNWYGFRAVINKKEIFGKDAYCEYVLHYYKPNLVNGYNENGVHFFMQMNNKQALGTRDGENGIFYLNDNVRINDYSFRLLSDRPVELNKRYLFTKNNTTILHFNDASNEYEEVPYRRFCLDVGVNNGFDFIEAVFTGEGWVEIEEFDMGKGIKGDCILHFDMVFSHPEYDFLIHMEDGLLKYPTEYLGGFDNTKFGDIPTE